MIRFDKIKIVSRIENVSNINENEFQSIVKDGIIHEFKYSNQSPFSLYIEIDYIENMRWNDSSMIEKCETIRYI